MASLSSYYPQPLPIGTTSESVVVATGSSASRSLGDRFGETVNVKDFGADPTGTQNSRTAIESAISNCPAYGTIWFPRGTYLIDTVGNQNRFGIEIPSSKIGITITGDNAILLSSSKNNPQILLINADDVTVSNLTFDGFHRSSDSWYDIHVVLAAATIKNIESSNPSTNTITITNHGFPAGAYIGFSNLPSECGLFVGKIYETRDVTQNTFKLRETWNGPEVDILTNITSGSAGIITSPSAQQAHMLRLFGHRTLVDNCKFVDCGVPAVVSRDGTDTGLAKSGGHRITNNFFKNCYQAIQMLSTNTLASVTGTHSDNVITSNGHGIKNGAYVEFTEISGGDGIIVGKQYEVKDRTVDTFKLKEISTGLEVDFTADITSGKVGVTKNLSDYVITNNTIIDNSFIGFKSIAPRGINIANFSNCPPIKNYKINNNYIKNGGNLAIEIFGQHQYGIISNNYCECEEMGVSCGGGDNIVVSGNYCRGGKFTQLEIAQSSQINVVGNLFDCKTSNNEIPENSVRCCINISNQSGPACDDIVINGNSLLNCITGLFTNATSTDDVVFSNNFISCFADSANSNNDVIQLFGISMENWIISNNLIIVVGDKINRIIRDSAGPFKATITGNTIVGECRENAIQFSNNGWIDISNNNFRDFTSNTTNVVSGRFLNSNATNFSARNNLSSDYSSLRKWIPDNQPIRLMSQDGSSWSVNVTNDGELELSK